MRSFKPAGTLIGLALIAAGANAQEAPSQTQVPADASASPAEAAPPTVTCIADPPDLQQAQAGRQPGAADAKAQPQQEKRSVAKDAGGAAGGTAAQLAGAAVAGPIGAAAAGVVGERIGRTVGKIVKGGKKKADNGAKETAAPIIKCAPAVTQSPQR